MTPMNSLENEAVGVRERIHKDVVAALQRAKIVAKGDEAMAERIVLAVMGQNVRLSTLVFVSFCTGIAGLVAGLIIH